MTAQDSCNRFQFKTIAAINGQISLFKDYGFTIAQLDVLSVELYSFEALSRALLKLSVQNLLP